MRSSDFSKLAVRLYILCACLAFGLGAAVLVGREERFSGPSFTTPRALVEWSGVPAYIGWAGLFIVYGILLVFSLGRDRAVHVLRFGIVVYCFLALSFLGSVAVDPKASITGVVAYFSFAMAHLFLSDHLVFRGWDRC